MEVFRACFVGLAIEVLVVLGVLLVLHLAGIV
jgi:hypothetical protein